jgi:large subunit ribosomal protein L34
MAIYGSGSGGGEDNARKGSTVQYMQYIHNQWVGAQCSVQWCLGPVHCPLSTVLLPPPPQSPSPSPSMLCRTANHLLNLQARLGSRQLSSAVSPLYYHSTRLNFTFNPAIRTWIQSTSQLISLKEISSNILEAIMGGIMLIKRTLQPSIIKKKRQHGYLARLGDRHGIKVLNRRRQKKRTRLV